MRIELIRHGATLLQQENRYQGVTDVPLSPEGREELLPVSVQPERVFVSPLLRAKQTAGILFPDSEQIVVPDFAEMDFGVFEGRNAKEMEQDAAYRAWVDGMCLGTCPGGESRAGFCARVCAAFDALVTRLEQEGEPSLVIVAHGGTQMAVMERFAEEKKSYYEWKLGVGQGYLLAAENWRKEHSLRILDRVSHVRG